jgi:hypothetical protein
MSLLKIVAHIECDKCGTRFHSLVPSDAHHQPEQTAFDIVAEGLDEVEGSVPFFESAGFYDGEFYCPPCWEPKSEELFIEDIKAGRVKREHLNGLDEKYLEYVP